MAVDHFHRRVQRSLKAVPRVFEQEFGPKIQGRQAVAREGVERRFSAGFVIGNAIVGRVAQRRHDWYYHAMVENNKGAQHGSIENNHYYESYYLLTMRNLIVTSSCNRRSRPAASHG